VLAHRSPLALAEIRSPLAPRRLAAVRLGQPLLFCRVVHVVHSASHDRSSGLERTAALGRASMSLKVAVYTSLVERRRGSGVWTKGLWLNTARSGFNGPLARLNQHVALPPGRRRVMSDTRQSALMSTMVITLGRLPRAFTPLCAALLTTQLTAVLVVDSTALSSVLTTIFLVASLLALKASRRLRAAAALGIVTIVLVR